MMERERRRKDSLANSYSCPLNSTITDGPASRPAEGGAAASSASTSFSSGSVCGGSGWPSPCGQPADGCWCIRGRPSLETSEMCPGEPVTCIAVARRLRKGGGGGGRAAIRC